MPVEVQLMYNMPVFSLFNGLFIIMHYVKMTWTDTIREYSKFENW